MHITDLISISASANLDESLVSERNTGQEGKEGRRALLSPGRGEERRGELAGLRVIRED